MRRSSKPWRDEEAFQQAKQDISAFIAGHQQTEMDLVFFDETGFSLQPCVPYGWTRCGEVIEIPSQRSSRLNVLGFWSLQGDLYWESHIGSVNTEVVIDVFDGYCESLLRETIVILDNASMHTSGQFTAQRERWADCGLHLYYLPTYSPELNWIEILWRKIKYRWLPISAYESFDSLVTEVGRILNEVGKQFQFEVGTEQYV